MTLRRFDAVIVGGGHNGLVCAAYLARAGVSVMVLEANEHPGGAAITREFHPGFRVDAGAHRVGWFDPDVLIDLSLDAHGLAWETPDPAVVTMADDGEVVPIWRDHQQAGAVFGRFAKDDVVNWPAFARWVGRIAKFVGRLRETSMPDLPDPAIAELPTLLGLGLGWRALGRRDMGELLRVLPLPLADLLDDRLDGDLAKGVVAAGALVGVDQGPLAQGTALPLFLDHDGGEDARVRPARFPRGGMQSLANALLASATHAGVEVRTGSRVATIGVEAGAVTRVVLEDGEEIQATRVISAADPRTTFLQLVDPVVLDPEFVRQVRNIRCRGATAKAHFALDRLPIPAHVDGNLLRGVMVWAPSIEFLERGHDAAKYGAASPSPMVELSIPTLRDPSLAPEGKHTLSAVVQWTPHALRDGTWDGVARDALAASVLEVLERTLPGVSTVVVASEVLAPPDLERVFGLPNGDLYHGQPALDQMFFMRPVGGWARHRTPITGLYLCSVGTHPGGGVTGAPGRLGARAVLADLKRGR